jgi:SAM-dependent methyltransferase
MNSARELWDQAVRDYLTAHDGEAVDVIFPAFTRSLGDLAGTVIMDYGCGDGRYARLLEALGADQVIGVDLSPTMIAAAVAADPASTVQYYVVPDNRLTPFADRSVDTVVANMVFMMSPSKADLVQSFSEIHRVLKPEGRLLYCITHPAFIDRDAHDCRRVFDAGFQYLQEGERYRFILKDDQGAEIDGGFFDYHYTLTTYIQTTINAGFTLLSFEELRYPAEVIAKRAIPKAFLDVPQSILVVARKTSAS